MSNSEQAPVSPNDPTIVNEPDRPLTEARLATLLMRLLGVYFAILAIGEGAGEFAALLSYYRSLGFDDKFERLLWYLAHPAVYLLISGYLLFGGQWVLDKVLTPVRRNEPDDDAEGASTTAADEEPGKNRDASAGQE